MKIFYSSTRVATILKILGIISMTVDHVGAVFFPEQIIWRLIGRLALPLFIFGIIEGSSYTRHHGRYILRLFVCALIAQPFFAYLFDPGLLNICFSLMLYLSVLYCLKQALNRVEQSIVVLAGLGAASLLPIDYGLYGMLYFLVLLGAQYRAHLLSSRFAQAGYLIGATALFHAAYAALGYMIVNVSILNHALIQSFSLIGVLCIGAMILIRTQKSPTPKTQPFFERYIFYIYFPAHLAVLALVYAWLYS